MKVGFRVDAGSKIGIGHLIRCIGLAEEFLKSEIEAVFLTKTTQSLKSILKDNFKIISLKQKDDTKDSAEGWDYGDENELKPEIDELKEVINQHNINLLIVDSYNVTEKYFLNLKDFVPTLCYIDDQNKYKFAVDILINGNVFAEDFNYQSYYTHTKFLLGTKFTIFRDEFKDIKPIKVKEEMTKVLITLGGSDPFNLTVRLLDIINSDSELSRYQYDIIIGRAFENREEILGRKQGNIIFHENISNMSELMVGSDIAISSGGSTLYEFARCGVPTSALIVAKNQEPLVEKMTELRCVDKIGWYDQVTDDEIKSRIKNLINDYKYRQELAENCLKLIDGKGTERIITEIIQFLK